MGQQQLLLIVLGVILVGVAVVLGIQYFSVGAEEGAKDELVAHCLTIGANAQQWYKKPVAMGGGGGSFSTANGAPVAYSIPPKLTASSSAGIIASDGTVTTAGYQILTPGDQTIVVQGTPNNPDYLWTVDCTINAENMQTVITAVTAP